MLSNTGSNAMDGSGQRYTSGGDVLSLAMSFILILAVIGVILLIVYELSFSSGDSYIAPRYRTIIVSRGSNVLNTDMYSFMITSSSSSISIAGNTIVPGRIVYIKNNSRSNLIIAVSPPPIPPSEYDSSTTSDIPTVRYIDLGMLGPTIGRGITSSYIQLEDGSYMRLS